MRKQFTPDQVKTILHRAFEKQMDTGQPFGSVAMHLLSKKRQEGIIKPEDQVIGDISARISHGQNTLLSMAYLAASISQYPARTRERVDGLCNMLEIGSPHPGLSIFSDHKVG